MSKTLTEDELQSLPPGSEVKDFEGETYRKDSIERWTSLVTGTKNYASDLAKWDCTLEYAPPKPKLEEKPVGKPEETISKKELLDFVMNYAFQSSYSPEEKERVNAPYRKSFIDHFGLVKHKQKLVVTLTLDVTDLNLGDSYQDAVEILAEYDVDLNDLNELGVEITAVVEDAE